MDVVYLCREGSNEELRYSLRSLSNLPSVGQVWIFGGAPDWVNTDKVNVVPVVQQEFTFKNAWKIKFENVRRNLSTAVNHPDVAGRFLLMNDDFYVTEALEEIPILHYGGEEDFLAFFRSRQGPTLSTYVLAELATLAWCRQNGAQPVSYALHVPLPVVKDDMAELLSTAPWSLGNGAYPLHIRTAYGNTYKIGGEKHADVKVERGARTGIRRMNGVRIQGPVMPTKKLPTPFASSSDRSFMAFDVGRWVRDLLTEPSSYER